MFRIMIKSSTIYPSLMISVFMTLHLPYQIEINTEQLNVISTRPHNGDLMNRDAQSNEFDSNLTSTMQRGLKLPVYLKENK